ncbi:MAG: lysophospholipid acyltransferase family protein [Elusimicrobiota bacterium]|jgi:1-acyl-sn-glycerol-3-phosphate acyltransferase
MSAHPHRPGQANPLFNPFLYFLGKQFTGRSFDLIWRRRVFGLENIPPAGTPVIFAANHRSLADPNLVGSAVPYPIHFFTKDELFQIPLLGWYIRRVNAFPVKREEHDVGAFRRAVHILEHGEALLLFPEGGRRLNPARQWKAKAGVGTLACMTGAQIVPVGVLHSERFTRLSGITVRFGKPIFPPEKEGNRAMYQELSNRVMQRIKELCDEPE